MADGAQGHDLARERLWQAIAARRVGMLSLTKSGLHAQPMIAIVEARRKRLWFVTRGRTELVRAIGDGGPCMFVLQDADLLASVAGELAIVDDPRRIARAWSADLAAWLPEGPADPGLTLLRMDCVDAELWVAGLGLTQFAWEIAGPDARPVAREAAGGVHATLH